MTLEDATDYGSTHYIPTYLLGMTLEDATGELRPLSAPRLRELLARHTASLPSLVFLSPDGSEEVGKIFMQAGVPAVVAVRGYLPEARDADL